MFTSRFSHKAVIVLAAMIVIGSANVFAESLAIDTGTRGSFFMNLGTEDKYGKEKYESIEGTPSYNHNIQVGGGGYLFCDVKNLGIHGLGTRLEFGFLANNAENNNRTYTAYGMDCSENYTYSYNSIELPLLVTYTVKFGPVEIMPLVGPYVSFPVGKMHFNGTLDYTYGGSDYSNSYDETSDIVSKAIFGITGGAEISYSFGKFGSAFFDARYLSDFTPTQVEIEGNAYTATKTWDFFTRRQLQLSLGYKHTF